MGDGDHSGCPVELLACPEHPDEQIEQVGVSDRRDLRPSVEAEGLFRDRNATPIVGFCLWCGNDFYSIEEADAHQAGDGKGCPVFKRLKGKQ
jgi:hypothetical protein